MHSYSASLHSQAVQKCPEKSPEEGRFVPGSLCGWRNVDYKYIQALVKAVKLQVKTAIKRNTSFFGAFGEK